MLLQWCCPVLSGLASAALLMILLLFVFLTGVSNVVVAGWLLLSILCGSDGGEGLFASFHVVCLAVL